MFSRLKSYCGITGNALKWFKSYIGNRTQTVLEKGEKSEPVNLATSVLQGSILGPLLFSIYILPLYQSMRKRTWYIISWICWWYTIIHTFQTWWCSKSAIRRLEMCIQEIRMWMTANKLKLNDRKTDFMVIVSAYYRQQLITSLEIAMKVGNTNIHPTMSVKNLGSHSIQTLPCNHMSIRLCEPRIFTCGQ